MASQDDLALLKQMYERGEISDGQYDALRRHVLWGTPLPDLLDEPEDPPYAQARPPLSPPPPPRPPAPARNPPDRPRTGPAQRPAAEPPPQSRGPLVDPRLGPGGAARPADPIGSPADRPGPDRSRAAGVPVGPGPVGWVRPDRPGSADRRSAGNPPEWTALDERSSRTVGPAWSGAEEPEPMARDGRSGGSGDGGDWAQPARKGGRRKRAPRVAAIGTSMLLALALVAAGVWWFAFRETGVPARDYARSVCSSVRDWQQRVDSRGSALTPSIAQKADDREAVRSEVRGYYTDLATRTDGLRTAVTGAGVVDVEGGKEYADSFAGVIGAEASALRDLAGRAERLDTASVAVFQVQLQTLLTGAQTSVGKITAALARPPAGTPTPLRTALSAEPSCAPYVG